MARSASTRRAFVLGAAGFLGSAVVRRLLADGWSVTGLVRQETRTSEFFNTGLWARVGIVHGCIEDTVRLRQLIALHEADTIFQCAGGESIHYTHTLTRSVLSTTAALKRPPGVVIPLRAEDLAFQPRFQSMPDSPLRVAFVRLPSLFGPGSYRQVGWIASNFLRAARGETLAPPSQNSSCLYVTTAAEALVAASRQIPLSLSGVWVDVPPSATSRELLAAIRTETGPRIVTSLALQNQVSETYQWYRERMSHFGEFSSHREAA